MKFYSRNTPLSVDVRLHICYIIETSSTRSSLSINSIVSNFPNIGFNACRLQFAMEMPLSVLTEILLFKFGFEIASL